MSLDAGLVVQRIVVAVALGIGLNALVARLVRGTYWAEAGHLEAPPWSYAASCFFQLFVFPPLLFLSISTYPSLWAHSVSSWDECDANGFCWMRVILVVLMAYLCKDIMVCNTIERVHHVAGAMFTFGFMLMVRGSHGYITGCTILEFANFFMNLSHIWPLQYRRSRRFVYGLVVFVFAAAHAVAWYSVYVTDVHHDPSDPTAFFVLHFLTGSVVMIIRQKTMIDNYKKIVAEDEALGLVKGVASKKKER